MRWFDSNIDAITTMCFYSSDQSYVLTGRHDRHVSVYSALSNNNYDLFEACCEDDSIRSIQATSDGSKIIVGLQFGEISIWDGSKLMELITSYDKKLENIQTWKSGNELRVIRLNPLDNNLLASGGYGNPLKVWDLNTGQAIFTAKNVSFFILLF